MRILALETSATHGSVALLDDGQLVVNRELPGHQRSAQSLVPTVHSLLRELQCPIQEIELFAVTQGPGSFTGLRVGLMTAKCLAYACSALLIGVDTLRVIAHQAFEKSDELDGCSLTCVLNAYRQQLFVAEFTCLDGKLSQPRPSRIVDLQTWQAGLTDQWLAGPVLKRIRDQLPSTVRFVDAQLWAPQAVAVGKVAQEKFLTSGPDDFWTIGPEYLRVSAAEEKERGNQEKGEKRKGEEENR